MESDSNSTSDSDDVLEDVTFLTPASTRLPTVSSTIDSPLKKDDVQSIGSKLDALLSGHKKEIVRDEIHQKIKDELLHAIDDGSQEESSIIDDEALNGELAEHIEQLDVTPPVVQTDHPTITIFNPNKFCCLFKENINPFSCGFSQSQFSKIDKVLATVKPDGLLPLLLSNTLAFCFHEVSNPHSVMMWLLSLLSVHSSPMVVDLCSKNMTSIIQKQEGRRLAAKIWGPRPIDLIRIFVNMGTNPVYLLEDQSLYADEVVREHLSVENDENDSMPTRSMGKVSLENCRHLFEILSQCLRNRPDYTKEELNLMMCVIVKVSLDASFQTFDLHRTFQACLSSLLECYKEPEWLSVVPCLCHQLSVIPQHHHCAVYLADLLPVSHRGNCVQSRLCFLFLCSTLEPECKDEQCLLQLDKITPSTIAQLGHETLDNPNPSHLYCKLHGLIKEDVYKMNSALTLLDRAVGDETNRSAQPKDELDFLTNQVKALIKDIRDSINTLDLSRIKDRMAVMTVKWMMMSTQKTHSVQRSLFSWVTSSVPVPVEKLKDDVSNTNDEEMEIGQV